MQAGDAVSLVTQHVSRILFPVVTWGHVSGQVGHALYTRVSHWPSWMTKNI